MVNITMYSKNDGYPNEMEGKEMTGKEMTGKEMEGKEMKWKEMEGKEMEGKEMEGNDGANIKRVSKKKSKDIFQQEWINPQ